MTPRSHAEEHVGVVALPWKKVLPSSESRLEKDFPLAKIPRPWGEEGNQAELGPGLRE